MDGGRLTALLFGSTSTEVFGSDLLCLWVGRVGLGGGVGVTKGLRSGESD